MAKSPKKPKIREDVNTTAFRTLQEALGEAEHTPDPDAGKDPAAVLLGRKGGLKGGKARAGSMSAEKRKFAASMAAKSRWSKKSVS